MIKINLCLRDLKFRNGVTQESYYNLTPSLTCYILTCSTSVLLGIKWPDNLVSLYSLLTTQGGQAKEVNIHFSSVSQACDLSRLSCPRRVTF